jgi:hypothetical protein
VDFLKHEEAQFSGSEQHKKNQNDRGKPRNLSQEAMTEISERISPVTEKNHEKLLKS